MGRWGKEMLRDVKFFTEEMEKLDLLRIKEQKIYVNPEGTKDKIENNHEALAAIIILAKNHGRETFKNKLKSVKEAYVQKILKEEIRKQDEEK